MKVSVVIPAHNEEKNIEAVIRSIVSQTYSAAEIIIVDNASTDRTAEIAKKFPVKVIIESRKGTQWAREAGRKAAIGDFIANIDADCIASKDWLRNSLRVFEDEYVVAVSGPYDYFDAGWFFRNTSLFLQFYLYTFLNGFFQKLRLGGVLIEGNVIFRASALEKIGGYNTDIVFYGDGADLGKQISKVGKIIFNRKLIMKTSYRRFKQEGVLKITVLYFFHFFKQIFKIK